MYNNSDSIKKSILEACLWLQEKGLVIGTWGNVSVRSGNKIILTPSRIDYNKMKVEDMVTIDMEGKVVEGYNKPTSEKEVHRLIYVHREDVGSVIHCHSEVASAACCIGKPIPPLLEEMSQLLGGEIPSTSVYIPAGHHTELGEEVARSIGDKNAVLIRNHGPVCCGRDINEALLACQVVEKAAKVYMSLYRPTNPLVITDKHVQEERYRYVYKYGKEG
jgi:Ribulose-5-phosphate 4-epimerase and related epimerases and aldolases